MKHIFILLLALSMMPSISRGDSLVSQMEIYLHYDNTISDLGGRPRAPIPPISVSQFGHTFTFPDYLAENSVEILSDDVVVFSSIIAEDGTVIIPESLTGEYTLVLHFGDNVYSAEVLF